jgi:hypothetical protein
MAKKTKTMTDMRKVLLDEIDQVRNGDAPVSRGQTVAKLANVVVSTVNTEIQFRKYVEHLSESDQSPMELT